MNHSRTLRAIGRGLSLVAYGAVLFMLLIAVSMFLPLQGAIHLIFRVIVGFYFFLSKNLTSMSLNADVLVPGLVGFLIVIGAVHGIGSSWSGKRGGKWSVISSIAVSSMLPLLFAISFLVPGVLLQVKGLVEEGPVLMRRGAGSDRAFRMMDARNHAQWIQYRIESEKLDQYPDAHLTDEMPSGGHDLMFPAAGLSLNLDPSFPVFITAAYRDRDGVMKRWVFRADEELIEIPASDVDEWLDRAHEMRRGME